MNGTTKVKETRDHFVARTYLRRFLGKNGKLLVCKKPDGNFIELKPETICCEKGWDLVKSAKDIFWLKKILEDTEPNLGQAIKNLIEGRASALDRYYVSCYFGILQALNPFQLSWMTSQHENLMAHVAKMVIKQCQNLDLPEEVDIAFLEENIKIEVSQNFIKMNMCCALQSIVYALYKSLWIIVKSNSTSSFITSDNPFNFLPLPPRSCPYPKFGALDPKYILFVFPSEFENNEFYDGKECEDDRKENIFTCENMGGVVYIEADAHEVDIFNQYIALGANRFIILGANDDTLKSKVLNNISTPKKLYEMKLDFQKIANLIQRHGKKIDFTEHASSLTGV